MVFMMCCARLVLLVWMVVLVRPLFIVCATCWCLAAQSLFFMCCVWCACRIVVLSVCGSTMCIGGFMLLGLTHDVYRWCCFFLVLWKQVYVCCNIVLLLVIPISVPHRNIGLVGCVYCVLFYMYSPLVLSFLRVNPLFFDQVVQVLAVHCCVIMPLPRD